MKESDWKLFKKIRQHALEKFCSEAMASVTTTINGEDLSAHERYLQMYKIVISADKELGKIFDGLSRSRAHMQLLLMRSKGIADENIVEQLSEEFKNNTNPSRFEQ